MSTAIKFENISKQYRLGLVSTNTISHDLNRWFTINLLRKEDPYLKVGEVNDRTVIGESEYIWALRNIDFEVKQGDVIGIIGKNGAGKSTLLKILSKVTSPTTGIIKASGRIASLLEVGTGFHPEMTGKENIYMNGAIMGMSKTEIDRKFDQIVDFSGVNRYLNTPVKRYSSGMTVRLGFAIAAHLDPDILVVDEVLAVGDAEFQKKAIGKMQDVSHSEGRTVLYVSHNMTSIKALCNNGIVLKNGMIDFKGNINDAVNMYLKDNQYKKEKILNSIIYHSKNVEINNFSINNSEENYFVLQSGKNEIKIKYEFTVKSKTRFEFEAVLRDINSIKLAYFCPSHSNAKSEIYSPGKYSIEHSILLPKTMTRGQYYLSFYFTDPQVYFMIEFNQQILLDYHGYTTDTGYDFNYKNNGLLIL